MSNPFGGFHHTSPLSSSPHHPPHTLLSNILRSHFGPTVQTISDALLSHGPSTLLELTQHIQSQCQRELNPDRVRLTDGKLHKTKGLAAHGYVVEKEVIMAGLVVLIHHSIVICDKVIVDGGGVGDKWKYSLDAERGKLLIRYPRFVEFAKKSVDEMAGVVVEELLVNGRLRTGDVVDKSVESQEKFMSKGDEDDDDDEEEEEEENDLDDVEKEELREAVIKSFKKLVEGGFVHMVEPLESIGTKKDYDDGETEMNFDDLQDPTLHPSSSSNKRKQPSSTSTDEARIHPSTLTLLKKHTRTLPLGAAFRVNIPMFHATIRAFCLGRLVSERYGDKVPAAGSIVTAALKFAAHQEHAPRSYVLSEEEKLRQEENKGIFRPDDIQEFLPPQVLHAMKNKTGGARSSISCALVNLGQYGWPQAVMEVEDASGHPDGGKFEIAVRQLVQHLRGRVLHQVVCDHHGELAARVCSLLQVRGLLECEAIAEGVMVPAKDVREILHQLFHTNYITLMNLQQGKSHNAATAIYLWTVVPVRMFKTVTNYVCEALLNLRLRRQHEVEVGKDWIERAKEAGMGDENESELDKENYQKFCQGLDRLDNACLELDESLMVLKDF